MAESTQSELAVGSPAPDFCLPSSIGDEVCLSDFRGKSQVVIFFIREFR